MDPDPDPLAGYPQVVEIPVQWGDQDALCHVNNTVYLRWFESSRIAYAQRLGVWDRLESANIGPILASVHCDYRRPLTYPDTVRVGSKVERIGRTSLTIGHRVVSKATGEVAAEGTAVLVLYDYTKAEPCEIPEPIRQAVRKSEVGRKIA